MRLINATTLQLHSFIDDSQLPKYAILSHTLGAEEVTFEDVRHARPLELKHMAGYQKIRLAAMQALRDGLEYVWVDTCCIDKSSSAELSESINSMFHWYKLAEICYAYLDDISVLANVPEPFVDERKRRVRNYVEEEKLAKARWFTRGWTLQELLAPDTLHFFIRDWVFIGDVTYLEPKIARITGIDHDAFDPGNKLSDYSVATRMSWAASRKTTRAEDMAYCLMGLFDVNMPLLYGEGGQKAFSRLQQEVLADSSDCSVFAWVASNNHVTEKDDEGHSCMEHDYQGGLSIFAAKPSEFYGCGDVQSSHTGEIVLTSIGVKLELPIFSLSFKEDSLEEFFVVMIRWADESHNKRTTESVGIVVRRCHRGRRGAPDLLLRQGSFGLVRRRMWHTYIQASDYRQMYLCKKVPDKNLLRRLHLERGNTGVDVQAPKPRAYAAFAAHGVDAA
ncbi:hypothetical protein NX059_003584 [Plenodomus lindquistii]|nr:hypothetical protein NX059_003584 [Plenodomus lindquistii]